MKGKINLKVLSMPANRGKHLIFVGSKVFKASDGKKAMCVLRRIQKKFPRKKVTLTYIPKADALILIL